MAGNVVTVIEDARTAAFVEELTYEVYSECGQQYVFLTATVGLTTVNKGP